MIPAFVDAGIEPGLEIWRIENFIPVKYPKNDHGKFYTGDSYIVLSTKGVVHSKGKNLRWDIHFWLGNETTSDESGAAAIMSVQLDDSLGGGPVQHREVHEHESALFLSYFPAGIRYLTGGVASGFHHVDRDAVQKRLFQVKGKRNVRVRQVELDVSSMNKGDCFILDIGKVIYIYTGANSSRMERIKAISAANQIRDQDHSGRSTVNILDESSTEAEVGEFFEQLGSGSPMEVAEDSEGGDDESFEVNLQAAIALWRVSDASGAMQLTKVGERPMDQTLLDTNDSFILDTVTAGVFAWIGKNATAEEKREAMRRAQDFLATNKYPPWTQIKRIVEGAEPPDFKQYFDSWRTEGELTGPGRYRRQAIVSSLPPDQHVTEQRIQELARSGGRSYGFMPDDGSGDIVVFRVDAFRLAPIEPATYGMFFGGDCYVVKYGYRKDGKDRYVIYFWLGQESAGDDQAAAAFHVGLMDKELEGKATQVRVTQGNEPRHFLRIFKGKLILFNTGRHTSLDAGVVDTNRMFQVRGTCTYDVRAVQVPAVTASLSSDDVFIIETTDKTYLWIGKGASEDEKEMARNAARLVPKKQPQAINEGEEPEDFWAVLGGKGPYSTHIDAPVQEIEPRLFNCRILANGKFRVEEIQQFQQSDLDEDDIMVLDSGEEIFVWVGSKADDDEKRRSNSVAEKYLSTFPKQRGPEHTLIFTLKQGEEPENFTLMFPTWDPYHWG